MAVQVIYKNIGIEEETSWGASTGGILRVLQIKNTTLNTNPNKTLVEDTMTSLKGRDRFVLLKNETGGDIEALGSPRILHNFLKLINGLPGASTAMGTSAFVYTYNQDTGGSPLSMTMVLDRNNTQEKFSGLRASKLVLKASNDILDATLSLMGKDRVTGVSVTDKVGETFKPLTFADMKVTIGLPSYSQVATLNVSEWQLEFDTGLERSHLSGARTAARLDSKVDSLKGNFKIFHTGNSFVNTVYGVSDYNIRFEGIPDSSSGLIAGVTPYYLKIDLPRVQLRTTTRNYEQNQLAVETIEFEALFDPGTSALWSPQLTVGYDIET